MVLKMCIPTLMHRTVPSGVDISAEYMFDENLLQDSPMSAFFRSKTIFITGSTGYLGQLLVERLLRAGVRRIYVLCRPKENQSPASRIQTILNGPIFTRLRNLDPNYASKVITVAGDLRLHNLGISSADELDVLHRTQVVIHLAAQAEPTTLLAAISCHLQGTQQLLQLCERMCTLQLFVHMSCAYAHSARIHVEECFYSVPIDPDLLIRLADRVHDPIDLQSLEILTDKLCYPCQSSNSFIKVMAEEQVRRFSERIPMAIIRPSIVTATSVDPMPGWMNTLFGLNGLMAGMAFGFIRTMRLNRFVNIDIICADFVTNSTLAIIWDVCKSRSTTGTIPKAKIFHITSNSQNFLQTGSFISYLQEVACDKPILGSLWYSFVWIARSSIMYKLTTILFHCLPATGHDWIYGGRWPDGHLSHYRRLQELIDGSNMKEITEKQIVFDNKNALMVYNRMTDYDKDLFPCDIRNMNWKQYIYEFALGARLYLIKEPFETLKQAQRKQLKLKTLHFLILICIGVLLMGTILIYYMYTQSNNN